MTEQRAAILNYLQKTYVHPTAEDVYKNVSKNLPYVSRATVFRNLKQLNASGKINEIDTTGASRFDGHIKLHQHLVCKNCNAIKDVSTASAQKFTNKVPPKISNWKIFSAKIIYEGLCTRCKR